MNDLNIFNYFDNKDFIEPNRDKEFTVEEKVSLIVHNDTVSLKKKFEDLITLKSFADAELVSEIEKWIEQKQNRLAILDSFQNENYVFVCSIMEDGHILGVTKTFKEALAIKNHACNVKIQIAKLANDNYIPRGIVGGVEFSDNGEISNVYFGKEMINDGFASQFETKLYAIQVKLKHPFKPFDIIETPLRPKYFIVANKDDDKVKNAMMQRESGARGGWLCIELPIYSFPNGWNLDPKDSVGVLDEEHFSLGQIRKVEKGELTVNQHRYIQYLRGLV